MGSRMEEIFDICFEKVEEGIPVDEVLEEYPEHREELKELLIIAKDIENAPLPRLRDEAVASCLANVGRALESRKNKVWRTKLQALQWPRLFYFPSPAWAKALAILLVVISLSWGTATLSADSLPGDMLYAIKLICEKVRFSLTADPEGKVELRLVYSKERMRELACHLEKAGELNIKVLKAMFDEASLALEHISGLPEDKTGACCSKLEHLCEYHMEILEGLRSKVTPVQEEELGKAIQICQSRMEWIGKMKTKEVPVGKWGPSCEWK